MRPTSLDYSPSNTISTDEQERILNNLCSNMVNVPGGTFAMGAISEQGNDYENCERPSHQVALSSFYIGKYKAERGVSYDGH